MILYRLKWWIFDKVIFPLFADCITTLIIEEVEAETKKYEDLLEECYKEIDERNELEGIRF